jgi:ribonucleoside-triphosphate reductase (thioredoxin)
LCADSEQTLASNETCCLAEIFLPNVRNEPELRDICQLLYRLNKHSLLIGCHVPEVDAVVRRNLRMGLGQTGVLQASETQMSWLSPTYKYLRQYDVDYSAKLGVPISRKLTTVKPSGTLSLVAGVTPGVHPAYSKFYIRRIRVDSSNPLVQQLRGLGHDVEYVRDFGGKPDLRTVVVCFPCRVPDGTVVAKDMTALTQIDVVERLQRDWSDNAVSCTIYYRKEELPAIRERLRTSWPRLKCVSFLLHSEHGFQQAPYEEITETQYNAMASRCKPMPIPLTAAQQLAAAAAAAAAPIPTVADKTADTVAAAASDAPGAVPARDAPTPRSRKARAGRWNDASAAHDSELLDDTECEGGSCPAR